MEETLDLGWKLLSVLPKSELDRLDEATIEAHYVEGAWKELVDPKAAS
jgi:V/A-type H+-transporting ATPase subunit B